MRDKAVWSEQAQSTPALPLHLWQCHSAVGTHAATRSHLSAKYFFNKHVCTQSIALCSASHQDGT